MLVCNSHSAAQPQPKINNMLKRPHNSRLQFIALGFLIAFLAVLVVATLYFINKDRAALVARFADDRLKQIAEAAREVGEDLDGVIQDLHFAGRLVQASDIAINRQQVLEALLGSVKPYRAAALYPPDSRNPLIVTDPRTNISVSPLLLAAMRQTAQKARSNQGKRIETSFPIKDTALSWYRVFAIPLIRQKNSGQKNSGPPDVLALLIDTEPFLEKLHLVAADPQSQLLIIGPHGRCAPMSDSRLCRAMAKTTTSGLEIKKLSFIVQEMLQGKQGTLVIEKKEGRQMGFEPADLIVAYTPIHIQRSSPWSVGMFTTTATLRTLEQKMMWRMGFVSFGISLAFIAFGSYILISSRRAAVLRERLIHADELAHIHEKSEKILENIPTGIMALSEKGCITTMNQAIRRRVPEKALGQRLMDAFPCAPTGTLRRLEGLVENAQFLRRPLSLLGERLPLFGEEGQYSLHAVPLEHPIQEVDVLLVLEDFTEVKTLESQLLRSEKLATVGILAAGVAHEIGTPLGVVRGRAEYILEKLGTDHKEAAGLRIIMDQIDRITSTIRELLDFSRIKPANVSLVALSPMVHKVLELLRYEISRRDLHIVVDISETLPLLAADADQLQQVFINLLMNACGACSTGAQIIISASDGQTDYAIHWDHVRLEIIDEGCGIPPENLHRVFDPFFTTKKRGQGTGLGLTIVSQIVRNHGAEIELKSEVGRGTQVLLRWPIAKSSLGESHAS